MPMRPTGELVVGLDVGGTAVNVTVMDRSGRFLLGHLLERPSRVVEGPDAALEAMEAAFCDGLAAVGARRADVVAVGLDTPGPASADGVIAEQGSTNFSSEPWRGFDVRSALAARLGLPVTYSNDGNAAAYYAHRVFFDRDAATRSSVTVVVGTGLGGGVVVNGRIVVGAAGMAGELGHVRLALDGIVEPDQPLPVCGCGTVGDAESIASLTAIERNLLPYWLARHPDHPLAAVASPAEAARAVRGLGEQGDPLARRIFEQQAAALGRLLTVCANVLDAHAYFVGGGVVEAAPAFRRWFLDRVRGHVALRPEQRRAPIEVVPDRDMAGARGAAWLALGAIGEGPPR